MENHKILRGIPSSSTPDMFRVNTKTLGDDIELIRNSGIKAVVLSRGNGYVSGDINFLYDLPDLEGVHMQEMIKDITPLYSLKKLKYLLLETKSEIDLSRFPELEHLRIGEWGAHIHNISQCKKLHRLYVYKFSPRKAGFELLYPGNSLRFLEIVRSTLPSLSGIECFTSLYLLELAYCLKLSDISQVINLNGYLDILSFEACKKVNLDILSKMNKLRSLVISKGGSIESIKFIKTMTSLEGIAILDTYITDHDMSPFIDNKYIKSASFTNNKSYSLKQDDIEKILASRTPIGEEPLSKLFEIRGT